MSVADKVLVSRRRVEFLILRRRFAFEYFCERCESESRFISLEDARVASGLTMREIVRRVETGEIHYLESLSGHLVICRRSLPVSGDLYK